MTGRVVTTYIKRPGGVVARIHGNAPLSPAQERAMADLVDAAYKQMGA